MLNSASGALVKHTHKKILSLNPCIQYIKSVRS
jgi:hypothetical protein